MTIVQILGGAIVWQSGFSVDADGAPACYAPPGLAGLDRLANAGHPGNWYGIVTNAQGVPVVQGPADPCPGFYISTTALVDHSKSAIEPGRYVDACTVPYVSVPPELLNRGVHKADVCMVLYEGARSGAIVADVGPHNTYGEGSIALARALGIPPSPRTGGVDSGVTWLVFPGSAQGWPRPLDEIAAQAEQLFEDWGGPERVAML